MGANISSDKSNIVGKPEEIHKCVGSNGSDSNGGEKDPGGTHPPGTGVSNTPVTGGFNLKLLEALIENLHSRIKRHASR
ncbi:hypothetical protein K1719_043584 [Acacia pycnantha]|nr:hypothetical protein K1719_043584 [Acacia pycnantha]